MKVRQDLNVGRMKCKIAPPLSARHCREGDGTGNVSLRLASCLVIALAAPQAREGVVKTKPAPPLLLRRHLSLPGEGCGCGVSVCLGIRIDAAMLYPSPCISKPAPCWPH